MIQRFVAGLQLMRPRKRLGRKERQAQGKGNEKHYRQKVPTRQSLYPLGQHVTIVLAQKVQSRRTN
jgi:hypothetical protein